MLLSLWLLLCLLVAQASVAAEGSRYKRLTEQLEQDVAGKRQFADIALVELAEVLLAEASLARRQARDATQGSADLIGWAVSVENYAGDVLRLQRAVQASGDVQLVLHPLEDLSVKSGLQSAMITHPRHDQQPVLEASIAAAFCARDDCVRILSGSPAANSPQPIPMSAESGNPAWSFTPDSKVCEQRGLRIEFPPEVRSAPRLTDERTLCQQLFAEANNLALELRWQARQGVALEWSAMVSTSLPQRTGHAVMLNNSGDTLLIALPLMHATPGLFNLLLPWLAAEVAGSPEVEVTLRAADLGWAAAQ